jgi:hypothetical protein
MAKSRRNTRRENRKSRRANRKSRSVNRKSRRGGGLISKLYSPVSHLLQAANNTVGIVTGTVNTVAKSGIRGVNRIGKSVTGHANSAVVNLISRKRRNTRRNRRN